MPERLDRVGQHKTAFKKNKQIVLATQEICALCGAPVDKSLKAPDPMSPTVDHIIPIAKGGHPSSLDNLQLAHRWCNLHKGDRLFTTMNARRTGLPSGNIPPVKNNPPAIKPGRGSAAGGNLTAGTFNQALTETTDGRTAADELNPRMFTQAQSTAGSPAADKKNVSAENNSITESFMGRSIDNDDLPLHVDWKTFVW